MSWLIILAFAVSSSVDNLGVGITYGIRKIRIGVAANLLIGLICFLMSIAGISFGVWLSKILPGLFPVIIGSFILIIIGIRIILLAVPRKKALHESHKEGNPSSGMKGILRNPEAADVDNSGEIGWGSDNTRCSLISECSYQWLRRRSSWFSPLAISLTAAIGSIISVWAGVKLGHKLAAVRIGSFTLGEFGTIISGIIILIIAITAFF